MPEFTKEQLRSAIEEVNDKFGMYNFDDPDMPFNTNPEMSFEDLNAELSLVDELISNTIPGQCPQLTEQTKHIIKEYCDHDPKIKAILEGQKIPAKPKNKNKFRGKINSTAN